MSRFSWPWSSLNFYKEYLFGFETLILATLHILYMHKQLVTRAVQLITYDYHAHLVSKAGSVIALNHQHLLSDGAAVNTQSCSSLTS